MKKCNLLQKIGENQFFHDFESFLVRFFFSKLKFFENLYKQPPIFFHPRVHKMINYMKFENPSFTTN